MGNQSVFSSSQSNREMGLSSLTNIDKFEKAAQLFYSVSLLAAPAWWVGDNFKDTRAPNNDVVICLATIMGILCSILTAMSYLVRSEVTTKRILVKADYVTAAGWGACAAFTVMKQDLYQAALFPRLYQSVMKASKSTAKPVLRAKSPARSKSPAKSPARSKSPSKKK